VEPNTLHSSLAALGDYCRELRSLGLEHLRVLEVENEGLKQEVEVLNAEHQDSRSVIQQLRDSLLQAEQQALVAGQRAAEIADQLSFQQQTFAAGQSALHDEIQSLTRQLEDKSRNNERLRQHVSDRLVQNDQLGSRIRSAEEAIDAQQQRTAELEQQLRVRAETLAQAEQSRDEHQRRAEELQLQETARAAELDQLRHDLAWVGGEKEALQQRTAELEHLLSVRAEVLAQAEQSLDDHQRRAEELQLQEAARAAELDQLRQDLAWVGGEKGALQQRTAELEHLLSVRAEVLAQAEQSRDDHQRRVEELQLQETARVAELDQLRHDLACVGGEKDSLKQEISASRQRAELLGIQRVELQEELEAVFLADRDKQEQLISLQEQIAGLRSMLEPARQTQDSHTACVEDLELRLLEKDVILNRMAEQDRKLQHQLVAFRGRNDLLQLQVQELQDELEQAFLFVHGQQPSVSVPAESPRLADQKPPSPQPASGVSAINDHRSWLLAAL
jgi:chromosome segregation ATPase